MVSQYKYIGLIIDEFIDYNVTARHMSKHASRALGSIIAKSKLLGGLPFKCLRKFMFRILIPDWLSG